MGVVIGVLAVLAGLVGAGLHAVNAAAGRTIEPSFWLMELAAALAYGLACLLLRATGARRIQVLLGAIALTQGLALLGTEVGLLTDGTWSTWLGAWLWAPGYTAIAVLLPVMLPDGRQASRPALWFNATAVAVIAVTWALTPYEGPEYPEGLHGATNPVGVAATGEPVVAALLGGMLLAAVIVGFASLVTRWRRAAELERQQLKWVLVGYACTIVLFAVARLLPAGTGAVAGLAMLPLPIAIGIAVMRYGLWDVDIVISRALVYAALSTLVIGLYAVTVWLAGDRLGATTGAPILATTVVALAALPLRSWLQRHVNRLVHGDVEEPYAVLARLGTRLAAATTPDDLSERVLPSVVEQVARSLRAQQATIVLRDGLVTSYGEGTGIGMTVELEYAGEQFGRLTVTRSTEFDGHEMRALDRLAAKPQSRRTPSCWRVRPSAPGRLWWSRGRRNAAGFVATCMTASARRSPHWLCMSRLRATSRGTTRRRLGSCSTGWCHGSMRQWPTYGPWCTSSGRRCWTSSGWPRPCANWAIGCPRVRRGSRCRPTGSPDCLPLWRLRLTTSPVRRPGTPSGTRAPGPSRSGCGMPTGACASRSPTTDAGCLTRCGPGSVRRRCGSGLRSSVVSCGSTPVRRVRR